MKKYEVKLKDGSILKVEADTYDFRSRTFEKFNDTITKGFWGKETNRTYSFVAHIAQKPVYVKVIGH